MISKPLIPLMLCACLAGCVPTTTFYWGDYSETLYAYKKGPDEKTLEAHKQSLQVIIATSPKKRLKVPPGVYAEYGYILLKEGKDQEGMMLLDKELELYPESSVLVKRIKSHYEMGKTPS